MKVYILTEGSSATGFGHVSRCLSLCQSFNEKGITPTLIVNGDDTTADLVHGFPYMFCDWINEKEVLPKLILGADILIIDSYLASPSYLLSLSKLGKVVAYIDDLNAIPKDGVMDNQNVVIIDWTPSAEHIYDIASDEKKSFLLGCDYVSLRKSFWDIPGRPISEKVNAIVIATGGSDMRNLSPAIVKGLSDSLGREISVNIIVGKGFDLKNIAELKEYVSGNVRLIFSPDEKEILELFSASDIAIAVIGQTIFELARVGVPTIAIQTVENQEIDVNAWQETGFVDFAGNWNSVNLYPNIVSQVSELISNKELREKKGNIGRQLIDGQGSRRIVQHLLNAANSSKPILN